MLVDSDCRTPNTSFQRSQYWYLLDATPDLFDGRCDFDEKDFVFWEASTVPFEGSNHAGIWSRWNSNGTYFTEGIATSLTEPLQAGQTYYFQMALLNQGSFQGLEGSVTGCTLDPEKHIDLYLDFDSITVVNDFSTGSASTDARMVATLDSEVIQGGENDEWTLVSTCFEAQGGETHFALIMPLGTFGELPPCTETMATSGVFRSFYYHIDDLSLDFSPESFEKEMVTCPNREIVVDLLDEFDFPLLSDAEFIWEDGFSGPARRLVEAGTYVVSVDVGCGSIPITLDITEIICADDVYVPNAFSPNNDGINDIFRVDLADGLDISSFRFSLFDRWGNIVFETRDPTFQWDGFLKGQKVLSGSYNYLLELGTINLEGEIISTSTGSLVILN